MSERDSKRFQERRNLAITNANMYISNNNNPFLVSPYSFPTGNFAKKSQVADISAIISTFIGDLSSIINLADFSLSISTITNIPGDNTVTISTTNVVIDAVSTTVNGELAVTAALFASSFSTGGITTNYLMVNSTITTSTLSTTNIQFTTLSGTTINAMTVNATDIYFNTLAGSTIQASTISASSIFFSTIQGQLILTSSIETGSIEASSIQISSILTSTINGQIGNFSTLNVSTLLTSTIDGQIGNFSTLNVSTLLTSTIDGQIGNFSTLNASTMLISSISTSHIEVKELIFSSICMSPVYISTAVTTFNSSILICMGGQTWKIPIEPV
jgi:hypothetical protein